MAALIRFLVDSYPLIIAIIASFIAIIASLKVKQCKRSWKTGVCSNTGS